MLPTVPCWEVEALMEPFTAQQEKDFLRNVADLEVAEPERQK
jgi:hypothetical protein